MLLYGGGYVRVAMERLKSVLSHQSHMWSILTKSDRRCGIVIGGQKLLLVLGVPASAIDYKSGLEFSKMEVLSVSSSGSWKGVEVANILQQISHKYTLSYVVSDNGTNLKSACQILSYIQMGKYLT